MRDTAGVALVIAGLVPLTLRVALERRLDRWHRSRTGRDAPHRLRRDFRRTLDVVALAAAVAGAILIATGG